MVERYRPGEDHDALWRLKEQFELELGTATGGSGKEAAYRSKLDESYRERYLRWADECVREQECIVLADRAGETVGYAFVLPERYAMIWDAAVLNEIFVAQPYRGTGVADDLMDAVFDIVEDQDLPLDRLVLDVDRTNERAQAFYDRYGFEHWGEMVAREL